MLTRYDQLIYPPEGSFVSAHGSESGHTNASPCASSLCLVDVGFRIAGLRCVVVIHLGYVGRKASSTQDNIFLGRVICELEYIRIHRGKPPVMTFDLQSLGILSEAVLRRRTIYWLQH